MLIFWVSEEKIDLILFQQIVNDSDPSPLAPSLRRPSNLPKSTASANDISCFWVEGKDDLKSSVCGIIKQVGDLLGENLSFDKVHMMNYTSLAHGGK